MRIKNTVKLFIVTVASMVLIACGETQRDVQWYMDNDDEMWAVATACTEQGLDNQNCKNSKAAATLLAWGVTEAPYINAE